MRMLSVALTMVMASTCIGVKCDVAPAASLTLIPPSPITRHVTLSVRASVRNTTSSRTHFDVSFYLDSELPQNLLYHGQLEIEPREAELVSFRLKPSAHAGEHSIIFVARSSQRIFRKTQPLRIVNSSIRSRQVLDGGWVSFYMPNSLEGKHYDPDLAKFTNDQWRELIRNMHQVGIDIVVIEEAFANNNMIYGGHNMERDGYKGKAYYPSRLYPTRAPITATDPIDAVLTEADSLHMHVFIGVGSYAFSDYTPGALSWSKAVVTELWEQYGHHLSLYGWYVTGESNGDLENNPQRWREIATFFREFRSHCRRLCPDKPIMLAPGCFHITIAQSAWAELLPNVDILCPFGFHRMPGNDISGEAAANLMQSWCDSAGTHLWLDLETFVFEPDGALIPRPIAGLASDLARFTNFETVLCFQYPGMMSAPSAAVHPGGAAAVKLFNDYKEYLRTGPLPRLVTHLALKKPVTTLKPFDARYTGGGQTALTDGILALGAYQDAAWQGYWGTDLDATVDLGKPQTVTNITVSFLQETHSGIFMPIKVEYFISEDNKAYKQVGTAVPDISQREAGPVRRSLSVSGLHETARYVRIHAYNLGVLPDWHAAHGEPAWLFTDEIVVH